MNSSSDRRVLDELDPDSTQTARDRQLIHHRRTADLLEALIFSQHPALSSPPAITTNSVYGQTNRRLAYLRPVRFAFGLETATAAHTILRSICAHRPDVMSRLSGLISALKNPSVWLGDGSQIFQETATTQWQKN